MRSSIPTTPGETSFVRASHEDNIFERVHNIQCISCARAPYRKVSTTRRKTTRRAPRHSNSASRSANPSWHLVHAPRTDARTTEKASPGTSVCEDRWLLFQSFARAIARGCRLGEGVRRCERRVSQAKRLMPNIKITGPSTRASTATAAPPRRARARPIPTAPR